MRSLLRADRLRYRRRIDLWIIGGAILALGALGYLSGYRSDSTDPVWPTEAEIRDQLVSGVDFGGMTQSEIDAQIELMVADQVASQEAERRAFEDAQAITLQKYDLAQSPFTLIGFGIAPLVALVFITTLVLGEEFRYGTVRSSLLAANDRRRFLAARLITFAGMIVGLFGALILLSVVLAVLLRLLGAEIPPPTAALDAGAGVAFIAAELLVTFSLVSLGVALTLLTRSGALPLLILLGWILAELFVFNLSVFQPGQALAAVPHAFLSTSIRTLLTALGSDSGAIALVNDQLPAENAIVVPTLGVAAIVAAWAILFLGIADRRFRRMDIVE